MTNFWQNRIVRYGEEEPDQLLANPGNPRIHPELQQSALKGALEEVGWIQDVIVNLRTSEEWGHDQGVETMVDGHLRVKLALRHGQPTVPVKYVDLTPVQERLALATLDPITGYAVIDTEIMSGLLDDVVVDSPDLTEFLSQFAEDEGIVSFVEDWSDLDQELEDLEGYQEIDIKITVPAMHEDAVIEWLANGESKTAPGLGKGVLKRCELL